MRGETESGTRGKSGPPLHPAVLSVSPLWGSSGVGQDVCWVPTRPRGGGRGLCLFFLCFTSCSKMGVHLVPRPPSGCPGLRKLGDPLCRCCLLGTCNLAAGAFTSKLWVRGLSRAFRLSKRPGLSRILPPPILKLLWALTARPQPDCHSGNGEGVASPRRERLGDRLSTSHMNTPKWVIFPLFLCPFGALIVK